MIAPSRTTSAGLRAYLNRRPLHHPAMVMILSAMARYPEVRAAARRAGPDVFTPGEVRVLATSIVTGDDPDQSSLSRRQREALVVLIGAVTAESLPDNAQWGLGILRRHVEDNFHQVLAALLRGSADQVQGGVRVSYVRGRVVHAFDIAEGLVPLDPGAGWEVING